MDKKACDRSKGRSQAYDGCPSGLTVVIPSFVVASLCFRYMAKVSERRKALFYNLTQHNQTCHSGIRVPLL